MLCHFFLAAQFQIRSSLTFRSVFCIWHFFLAALNNFSLYLIIRSLIMMCVGINFFECLEFQVLHKREILVIISVNIFQLHNFFSLSFGDSDDINIKYLVTVLYVSVARFISFSLPSFYCSNWENSIAWSSSSVIFFSSAVSILLLSLSSEIF